MTVVMSHLPCDSGQQSSVAGLYLFQESLIEPHYPKTSSKGGRPPYPLETMLRIHLRQQWYYLSDPVVEDALIEMATMRRFAGISMINGRIPDQTTIPALRHLLEKHDDF